MTKKDDGKTNFKSIGFLKLMPISQLDPNKLNSNKEVLQRFFKIQSKYPSCVSKKKVAEELLPEILVNYGKIPCHTKSKTTYIKIILKLHEEWRSLQKKIAFYKGNLNNVAIDCINNFGIKSD